MSLISCARLVYYLLGWSIKIHLLNSGGRDIVPWAIVEATDIDRLIGSHWTKVLGGVIDIDRMLLRKKDVEEKIEHSFCCDPPYITNRNSVYLVWRRQIYERPRYIKRKSAFLTKQQAAVNFALRKGFIQGGHQRD